MKDKYFLPYQKKWLTDKSRIKIWEKSRRIGATYVQSFEDVTDCLSRKVPRVYFSSADITAAEEYIQYCKTWVSVYKAVAEYSEEIVILAEKDIKTFKIRFANGTHITALSSNPKGFRSKGGKVVLDEFAWHENANELWKAAKPAITWGYPLRILSTHHGKQSLFYNFCEKVKNKELPWSIHTVDIYQAVNDGLVDKIKGHPTNTLERSQWLQEEKTSCANTLVWSEEYECHAVDEATAFFTFELIEKNTKKGILSDLKEYDDLYAGLDIARTGDKTVLYVISKENNIKTTRHITVCRGMPFMEQYKKISDILKKNKIHRLCVDATGLGMQLAEMLQQRFGRYMVECCTMTNPFKEEITNVIYTSMEDNSFILPDSDTVKNAFHSIKKIITASGNIRFDSQRNSEGHADEYWAAALSNYAASRPSRMPKIHNRKKKKNKIWEGYQ
ncbi:MAG: terminase family protein [Spirochaetales bacterium]|nr:terminase family protein [Spirochaetales bacterium]